MKTGFYPRLAIDGIRKNRRAYIPYILTCAGMVMMQYIIIFLKHSKAFLSMRGAETAVEMMGMGVGVIAVFSAIFLFYTNSFLIKQRKREFGLYNVLGMGKRNICFILFWESLFIALIALIGGLFFGILFSKFAELGLASIIKSGVPFDFSLPIEALYQTALIFSGIFVLLYLNEVRQVRFSKAVSLLKSDIAGEKPPKANWVTGILGVLILAAAYYIAVSIEDPISAIAMFFIAVIMVIVGTYLVMISGSVLLCRILQKRKSYYYKPNHFISVSSMAYRMKRNGAGLASICILSTMVLVMLSATSTLYIGSEDAMYSRYPGEISMSVVSHEAPSADGIAKIKEQINNITDKYNSQIKIIDDYRYGSIAGALQGNCIEPDVSKVQAVDLSQVVACQIVPLEDYNRWANANESLLPGEALLYAYRTDYTGDTLTVNNGGEFKIKKQIDSFFGSTFAAMDISPTVAVVVPDFEEVTAKLGTLADYKGNRMLNLRWDYNFDTSLDGDSQIAMKKEIKETLTEDMLKSAGFSAASIESREEESSEYYGLFGGIFYLGIILSLVFIFAAVLIIYYKQVSEGYEDSGRFDIMQKVGITKREIRKSINSQLLTVFFLPLVTAGVHLAFAFPILCKLLLLFNLNNVPLFAAATAVSLLVFALFYAAVYKITSNAYYKIVSK